jgi:hypothetical protein
LLRKPLEHVARNGVGYLALFVALGGTSYAAVQLNAGSVGTVHLKANAVTSAKVRNGSLQVADLSAKARRSLTGARGRPGATGPQGVPGPAGPPGPAVAAATRASSCRAAGS